MSRSGFPARLIVRYADALTDAPSSVAQDSVVHIDGRWNRASVFAAIQRAVSERRAQLARDRYEHPIYPRGYETKNPDTSEWTLHPMPYVIARTYPAWVAVPADRPGTVVEAYVIRTIGTGRELAGGGIEVYTNGELAGWVTGMAPIVDRRLTVGWTATGRVNNGQPDTLTTERHAPAGNAAAFDDIVRAIVRRYKGWA